MMFRTSLLVCICLTTLATAAPRLLNPSFTRDLSSWQGGGKAGPTEAAWDAAQSVEPQSGSARLTRTDQLAAKEDAWKPYLRQPVSLEPDTDYELTAYLKGKDLLTRPRSGAYLGISDGKKVLHYGRQGLWRYDTGTFDWTRLTCRFSSTGFNPRKIYLTLGLRDTTGTVWFDGISLRKLPKPPKAASFQANLFPIMFLKDQPWGICENLPGCLNLQTKAKGPVKGKTIEMTMDVPDFLTLVGICETFPSTRNGKRKFLAHPITRKPVTRDGKAYQRCHVVFDSLYSQWFGQNWYTQNIVLQAKPGTAGRKGLLHWSMTVGKERQPEKTSPLQVLPPVTTDVRPAKFFQLFVTKCVTKQSPFPDAGRRMTDFWQSLVDTPIQHVRSLYRPPATDFDNWIMVGGNNLMFPYPRSRQAYNEFMKTSPANIDDKRKVKASMSPVWMLMDDADGRFEAYLRDAIREWRREHPTITKLVWDFEPHPIGYDDGGRARFAKAMKLKEVPSAKTISARYHRQWFQYMVKLHADYIRKIAAIFREEAPGTEFWLCSDNLHAGPAPLAAWCGVDVRLSDDVVDGHMHMPYYTGTRFYDDVKFNVESLSKPFLPLNDPAERSLSFFSQYSPAKIRQNIIASAALGCTGFGLWPDDVLTGEYYHQIADAYGLIAQHEDFYARGRRCDQDFTVEPVNAVTKVVTAANGKSLTLHFPDFSRVLRYTVHRLPPTGLLSWFKQDDFLVTVFNYHDKLPAFLKVSGQGMAFYVDVPAQGAVAFRTSQPPEQAPLERKAADIRRKLDGSSLREMRRGSHALEWCAGPHGEPYFKMTDGKQTVWIDTQNGAEVRGLFNAKGNDLLGNGFLARLIFYDTLQEPVSYDITDMAMDKDKVRLTLTGKVPPYNGAIPNPLLNLEIQKTYTLMPGTLKIDVTYTNGTDTSMTFGVRCNNYPQPGSRLGNEAQKHSFLNGNDTPLQQDRKPFYARKDTAIPFIGTQKAEHWDGNAILVTAKDGALKDELRILPGPRFGGLFCWFAPDNHTVELLTPELTLPPAKRLTLSYQIDMPTIP